MIDCLCVTHDRPQWLPWMRTQIRRQIYQTCRVIIVDDVRGIAAKRNDALSQVSSEYFAWFDDDDWSSPDRLDHLLNLLDGHSSVAAGPMNGFLIDAKSLKSVPYRTREPMIFNGALYRTDHWKNILFNESLQAGEDTDWQWRGFRGQDYIATERVLSSWLCHGQNITNKSSKIIFENPFPHELQAYRHEFEENPGR